MFLATVDDALAKMLAPILNGEAPPLDSLGIQEDADPFELLESRRLSAFSKDALLESGVKREPSSTLYTAF